MRFLAAKQKMIRIGIHDNKNYRTGAFNSSIQLNLLTLTVHDIFLASPLLSSFEKAPIQSFRYKPAILQQKYQGRSDPSIVEVLLDLGALQMTTDLLLLVFDADVTSQCGGVP
ncbi:hypothetical protein LZ554_006666 [Drepanopeziza brunnea f. sp. 'monogermtubi']|nr:hypothetical protein LZ554_006666 [Drepanopeziza brunnea f. sp. 'monogermtubi']